MAVVSMVLSGLFLYIAHRTIPISTAYIVWTGIAAVFTFAIGILWFGDSASILRMFFFTCLPMVHAMESIGFQQLIDAKDVSILFTVVPLVHIAVEITYHYRGLHLSITFYSICAVCSYIVAECIVGTELILVNRV